MNVPRPLSEKPTSQNPSISRLLEEKIAKLLTKDPNENMEISITLEWPEKKWNTHTDNKNKQEYLDSIIELISPILTANGWRFIWSSNRICSIVFRCNSKCLNAILSSGILKIKVIWERKLKEELNNYTLKANWDLEGKITLITTILEKCWGKIDSINYKEWILNISCTTKKLETLLQNW